MLTYEDSGVSVNKNDELVEMISANTGVSTGFSDYQPIPGTDLYVVQSSDGVGTKIQLALDFPTLYNTIGQDLVAMCVNDLICSGAVPAYFQDYIGMNSLDRKVVEPIIKSINDACEMGGVKLTGGEMAEMPGTYATKVPELVGFATGFAHSSHIINKANVKRGMVIIGLPSSGPHSNGYSLIRKIPLAPTLLYDVLEPTKIYYKVAELHNAERTFITSMAHITGGGLENNLARAIPAGLKANIDYNSWQVPIMFQGIQQIGNVEPKSMWTTFNMGVGMCLIVDLPHVSDVMDSLVEYSPFIMGEVLNK